MPPPSVSGSSDQWQRVAVEVRRRRSDLGDLTVDDVIERAKMNGAPKGMSRTVVSLVENARQNSYSERTLRALSVALWGRPDAVQRILDGEAPTPDPEPVEVGSASAVEAAIEVDPALNEHARAAMIAFYRSAVEASRQ